MAINTYTDLISEVEKWLNRDDSTTVESIPTFIHFAEAEIFRVLKVREYEKIVEIEVNGNKAPIPKDLEQLKEIYTGDGTKIGRHTSHRELVRHKQVGMFHDDFYFATVGDNFFFHSDFNKDSIFCHYFWGADHLSYEKPVTPLLRIAPDLLLFTALKHGAIFSEDVEKVGIWDAQADNAMAELIKREADNNMSGSNQVIEKNEDTLIYY